MKKSLVLVFAIMLVLSLGYAATAEEDVEANNPWDDAEYVGNEACYDCHSDLVDTWYEDTVHGNTVQPASEAEPRIPDEVWFEQGQEAFDEATEELREKGVSVFTEEIPPYEDVSWVMGGYLSPGEYQIYFTPVETEYGTTYVSVPVRWYGAYSTYTIDELGNDELSDEMISHIYDRYSDPDDIGDYRERDWQRCFTCHSGNFEYAEGGEFIDPLPEEQRTDPKTGKVLDDWGWRTPEFEQGVSCEACHGPGGDHVEDAAADSIYGPYEDMGSDELVCGRCHVRGASDYDHMEKAWDRGGWWSEEDGELQPTEPRELGFPYGYMPGDSREDVEEIFSYGDATWANWYPTGNYPRGHGQVQEYYHDASYVKDYGEYTEGDEFVLEEFQEPPHADYADCMDCHTIHEKGESEAGIMGQGSLVEEGDGVCTQCHTQDEYGEMTPVEEMYEGTGGVGVEDRESVHLEAGTECIDCHMPQMNYPLRSHRFNMVEPEMSWDSITQREEDSPMITSRGRGRSMADRPGEYLVNSCQNAVCHSYELVAETDDAMDKTYWEGSDPEVLQNIWEERQKYVKEKLDKIEDLLDRVDASGEAYEEAKANYEFVKNDGSYGMHNYQYTIELLEYSKEVLEDLEKDDDLGVLWDFIRSLFR